MSDSSCHRKTNKLLDTSLLLLLNLPHPTTVDDCLVIVVPDVRRHETRLVVVIAVVDDVCRLIHSRGQSNGSFSVWLRAEACLGIG